MATIVLSGDGNTNNVAMLFTSTVPSPANPLYPPVIIDSPTGFDAPILNPDGQMDPNP